MQYVAATFFVYTTTYSYTQRVVKEHITTTRTINTPIVGGIWDSDSGLQAVSCLIIYVVCTYECTDMVRDYLQYPVGTIFSIPPRSVEYKYSCQSNKYRRGPKVHTLKISFSCYKKDRIPDFKVLPFFVYICEHTHASPLRAHSFFALCCWA